MKRQHKKWTTEEKNTIIEMINKGYSYQKIADLFDTTEISIKNIGYRNGIKKRNYKKWTKEEIQKIIDLYCKGYKYTDIAKMFKVSKQSIWSVIQRRKREV